MRGVFLDFATVSRGDVDLQKLRGALDELTCYPVTKTTDLPDKVWPADVLLTNKIGIDRAVMEAAPALKLVCLAATGYNNVNIEIARERGIAVCNIRGYCSASVAQHVFALILNLTINLAGYQRLLHDGAWQDSPQFTLLDFPIRELAGKTLGIVGYGELGKAVARLAEAFGMRVLPAQRPGASPQSGRVPLRELLPQADVLSLHCPLTPHTRGLIGARELALFKSDALLINTARGALVDEAALADALRRGRLGGAGIDVLSEEPPVNGNPLLADDIPNLIITPHIAWAAREARQRAVDEMAENIAAFRRGERRNRIV